MTRVFTKISAEGQDLPADAADQVLSDFAEGVVRILVDMQVPGVQWLALTEAA